MDRRTFVTGLAALASVSRGARAQGAPLRILVGFPPGGGVDIVARAFAEAMRASLGRNVLVENRSGAAGALAVQTLVAPSPDDNTILLSPASVLTLRPLVDDTLRVDPMRDLAPISLACEFAFALAVGPATPARTLKEFIAWCRANPERAAYGSPGSGTGPHLIGAVFAKDAGIPLLHVPYRGGAQATNDLLGGQLPAMVTTLPQAVPAHASGKLRILASTGTSRVAALPGVPTFAEEGFAQMRFEEWFGFFARSGTARALLDTIGAAVRAAAAQEGTRRMLSKLEFTPRATSAAELATLMSEDTAHWSRIMRRVGMQGRN